MKLYVLKSIKLKKAGRLFDIAQAATVQISKPEKAQALINTGHVRACQSGDISKPFAARIFSKILDAEIWIVTSTEASAVVPDGEIFYLPEEIQNLRGATEDEIRAVHRVKRELGGILIAGGERNQ